jgi:hypothetical protein
LHNAVQSVQTFYQMREVGRTERNKDRGPRLSPEPRKAYARTLHGLDASQMDPATGALHWPGPLQEAEYSAQRSAIGQYASKWVRYGTLDYADQRKVRENVVAMFDALKSHIAEMPPQDYVTSRSFLQSLLYATTKSVI